MVEIRQLYIFCTAAYTLNFTKAATKLGYAQSNITSQIRLLENELHTKLFERFGRGLQLTSAGKTFLKNAENILQLCERAKGEFSPQVFSGIINIGAAETLCVYRLPRLLLAYRQQYPHAEIRVQTESCQQLLDMIRANRIDVALSLTKEINEPDMAVTTLCNEPMVLIASPQHPLARRETVEPQDLSGECLILTTAGCGYRPVILSSLQEHGAKPGGIMELSSVGAIKECTVCGLGVTILPEISIKDELRRGRLIALPWTGPAIDVKTQLIYHRDKWLSPAIKGFLELCESVKSNIQ